MTEEKGFDTNNGGIQCKNQLEMPCLFPLVHLKNSNQCGSIARRKVVGRNKQTYRSLNAAIIIGDTFHISWILPKGDTLIIECAAPQDQTCSEEQITVCALVTRSLLCHAFTFRDLIAYD